MQGSCVSVSIETHGGLACVMERQCVLVDNTLDWDSDDWGLVLVLPLTCWVTVVKSLHHSVPRFPQL